MISKRKYIYFGAAFLVLIAIIWLFSISDNRKEVNFSERVKISLRDVGNQLLLENQDSTSLVLPVISLDASTYTLSFERSLAITPNTIVNIVKESFKKAELPEEYFIEVIQCEDQEVAYSYGMFNDVERDIVPCANRILPENCFMIKAHFTEKTTSPITKQSYIYVLLLALITLLSLPFLERYFIRFRESKKNNTPDSSHTAIGMFRFYPEQNKLVKEAVEIGLSKKECELLAIFVAQPNQVIRRDELTKRVWEDNGVIVGRSLDTYISKLRKKLQEDTSIKISNVHGVGYKLEIKA